MRILDLAFAMLILNGCLLVVNGLAPMGENAPTIQATEFDDLIVDIDIPKDSEDEGSESFLRKALTAMFGNEESGGFFGALKNTIFMGELVNDMMSGYLNLELPLGIRLLLDAMSSFIYSLGMIQLFMRFKAE